MKKFDETAPYQIVDHLYDVRKDFIILGLCGKVGSGVSTVSSILEKRFSDLQLPDPSFDNPDRYIASEYRILYNYAKSNWIPFYKIRTSSLITRHLLKYEVSELVGFLDSICGSELIKKNKDTIEKIICEFYEKTMSFNIDDACKVLGLSLDSVDFPDALIKDNNNIVKNQDDKEGLKKLLEENRLDISEDSDISFSFDVEKNICEFQNKTLSKMLDIYTKRRNEKSGFKNPFWYMILKQYLFDFLPDASSNFWNEISSTSKSLRILALQHIGNNLRFSKTPYFTNKFEKDGYNCLAEDINLSIKVFRAYQLKLQEYRITKGENDDAKYSEIRTIIVIDSIKNPYEAMYLRERYSNFFLIGIYTEDSERKTRLREKEHLTDTEIVLIDIIEQNSEFKKWIQEYDRFINNNSKKKEKDFSLIIKRTYEQFKENDLLDDLSYISPFITQNVSSCLDSADILINNMPDNKSHAKLMQVLLRYVSLIMNPALVLPTPVERCMQIAYTAKPNSGCISRQVGAVLTDQNYHLLSVGWNQQPEGQLPCSYRDLCVLYHHWDSQGYSDYENDDNAEFQEKIKDQVIYFFDTLDSPLKQKGKLPCYCFKDYYNKMKNERNQVHTRSLHAEETAFLNLGANKIQIENGILFTTSSPCELCAKKAMYLGVKKIYYVEPYPGVSEKHVMSIGIGSKRPELILFTGAIGTAYNKLYTPLIPRKDENEMWLNTKMDTDLMNRICKGDENDDENPKDKGN